MEPLVEQANTSIDTVSEMIQGFFAMVPQILIALFVFIVILVIASSSHPEEAISCFAGKSRIVAIRDLQREKLEPHKNVKF